LASCLGLSKTKSLNPLLVGKSQKIHTMSAFWIESLLQPHLKLLKNSLIGAVALGAIALEIPVQALQVRVTPENPQLGDTISVVIETDNPASEPKVFWQQRSYPAFAINSQSDRYRAFLPTSPLNKSGKMVIQVEGDGEKKDISVLLRNRSFPVQRIWLSKKASQPATQLELNRVGAFKKLLTPQKFWNGPFLAPSPARISSIFGVRRYYNNKFANNYYHRGVDYAGGYGSPVFAPAAGRVELVGLQSQGFRVHGNTVGIDHGQGVVSIFLHLSKINVRQGDIVRAGQNIGNIGSTGAASGPHLHWGLFVNEVAVDPVPWRHKGIE
jgi:murein DD-endopeptidase MepM/ murein hydrolase activator NlpD